MRIGKPRRQLWCLLFATSMIAFDSGAAWATPPATPSFFGIPVEPYPSPATYECSTVDPHRVGASNFRAMVLDAYPASTSGDLWAACDSAAHVKSSYHHAGRAWDWFLTGPGQRPTRAQRAMGDELTDWLLATVNGTPHMRLRRLGITEVIWFERIWLATTTAWQPYTTGGCPDPNVSNTTCHRDHVHFSFSVEGADGDTSWWQGIIGWLKATLGSLL